MKIYQVSCGFRNSFFLVENRKIYYTGFMESGLDKNLPMTFNIIEKVFFLLNINKVETNNFFINIVKNKYSYD